MVASTKCATTLLNETRRLVAQGQTLAALQSLRDELTRLRNALSPANWRLFCESELKTPELTALVQTGVDAGWEADLGFRRSLRARQTLLARELSDLNETLAAPRVLEVSSEGAGSEKDGGFDLIYVPMLLDALNDMGAAALLAGLARRLKSGGRLLALNFSMQLKDAAYLEGCLGWWPYYRGEEELAALAQKISQPALRGHLIVPEETGGSLLLDLQAV